MRLKENWKVKYHMKIIMRNKRQNKFNHKTIGKIHMVYKPILTSKTIKINNKANDVHKCASAKR